MLIKVFVDINCNTSKKIISVKTFSLSVRVYCCCFAITRIIFAMLFIELARGSNATVVSSGSE